jgi:SAM-dependent MidA family methyltransferase
MLADGLKEIYVEERDGHFSEILDQPSHSGIGQYFERLGIWPKNGQHICVNLKILDWLQNLAKSLEKGYIITIDYGTISEHLIGEDVSHIRVLREHQRGRYPYQNIGEVDITSDVDFTSLILAGRDFGLEKLHFLPEHKFFNYWLAQEKREDENYQKIMDYFFSGNYHVLIQHKNSPKFRLA